MATLSIQANQLLLNQPQLIELHGVDEQKLSLLGFSKEEFVYILADLRGAEVFHRIDGSKKAVLSEYRSTFLRHPKVGLAWRELIRGRFISQSPFTDAVDALLQSERDHTQSGQGLIVDSTQMNASEGRSHESASRTPVG
ncbi:MAG: hypothetical protein A3H57_02005 [Candidatus Taylorbacteria bacterium RIFCSPLOWO2_02_FULL_43_11]|nr:MAG: hypothetical protein A3H57_02005 [Candidatus Taylorbacteria bacterium RIFCSPLOWO2_02_FULL_43_11]